MIVQCTSCQTKFRVPDDKIGDKAVKVRCSKCQSVFGVRRGPDGNGIPIEMPAKASAPPLPVSEPGLSAVPSQAKVDPFAAFGPPPEARPEDRTRAGVWHGGIAATRRAPPEPEVTKPGFAINALMASKLGDGPAVVAPKPAPPPPIAISAPPGSAPDPFADLMTPAPAMAVPSNFFAAFDESPGSSATLPPQRVPVAAAPAPAADPFAALSLAVPKPAPVADPFADLNQAPPRPAPAPAADPFADLNLAPAPSAPTPLKDPFAALNRAPPPTPPTPAAPAANPFADLETTAPAAPAASHDPFADLDLSPPAPKPALAPAADPFANLDLGALGGKSAAPAPIPAPPQPPAPEPLPQSVTFSFESMPAVSAPAPAQPADVRVDDFFGAPEPTQPSKQSSAPMDDMMGADHSGPSLGEPDRSMFELPAPPPPSASVAAPLPSEPLAPATFEAPARPTAQRTARPVTTSRAAPKKPIGQRVLGGVLNALSILAVGWASLLTYATYRADWHFEPALLRPAELGRAVFGSQTAASQLVFEDISSGLYELAGGRTAFFVRGTLVNRGKAQLPPARAHIEVLEDDKVVAQTDAWAGKAVTPEQVYNLGDASQLKALDAQIQSEAHPLGPGESRPFVAVMLDVPAERGSRAVRIVPDLGTAKTP